jgi:hypothetical protein
VVKGFVKSSQVKSSHFAIETGISVHPDFRNKKLGQFVVIKNKEALIRKGFDFSVYWLDSRHDKPWHNLNILGSDKNKIKETCEIALLCKSYNLGRLSNYEKLGPLLNSLTKIIQFIYPLKSTDLRGYRVSKFEPGLVDKYLDFVQGTTAFEAVSTGFDRESFHRLYGPQNRESFFYSLMDETYDSISALAFGINEVSKMLIGLK